ncbi:MAG: HpcH/HpaI aldolase family protein [Planctomycetaceae bacterium]
MNVAALRRVRSKLQQDQTAWGLWVTLESASVTEIAVGLGLDYVVIDTEHGHLDWGDVVQHVRAAVRSETVTLVRVTELNGGLIKRALDVGADGVVIPWIETAAQLEQAVAYAHYPPRGVRGVGGERATAWGRCLQEHVQDAEEHVLVVPILETVKARQNIEELCRVPGVDLYQFGPADYSSSAGYAGQWEGPGVAADLQAMKQAIRAAGRHCGVLGTSSQDLLDRQSQGFRWLGLGMDAGLLVRALSDTLQAVGSPHRLQASLHPVPPGETATG